MLDKNDGGVNFREIYDFDIIIGGLATRDRSLLCVSKKWRHSVHGGRCCNQRATIHGPTAAEDWHYQAKDALLV